MSDQPGPQNSTPAPADRLALGIALSASLLVAAATGAALARVWNRANGAGEGPDLILINALLLGLAIAILGWRRYDHLHREVLDQRRAERHKRAMAQTDPLTGCLNRHSIALHTDPLIETAQARGESVAFVMVDINNFKQINDRKGYAAGDAILAELARRIAVLVPPEALVARLGGDEFACVIPFASHDRSAIDHIAAAISAALGQLVAAQAVARDISAAIGIADTDAARPLDSATLLHRADIALYQAKKRGHNQVLWFAETMESELRYRCEMEIGIRAAIPRGEFVPYYEQQVDLRSGELRGFEMLARWHSPVFGLVGPDVFIPIAEEIGVIGDLSESVIAQALLDARDWDPALTLSVNISPLQMRDPWFAQKLLKLLVEANFPPPRLEIEITESCLHQNIAIVQSLITSLRNQGITVSLDDFGTGYSSLSQLRKLPFDRIKIDRSFVSAMASDPDSRTIVEVIAALGRGLGLPITAEGIENTDLLDRLRDLGEFKGQGYLYGQPQPAAATRILLSERHLLCAPAPEAAPVPESAQRRSA